MKMNLTGPMPQYGLNLDLDKNLKVNEILSSINSRLILGYKTHTKWAKNQLIGFNINPS